MAFMFKSDKSKIDLDDTSNDNEFWNKVYPVGSIYMSVNNANPNDLFGGSWEQIQGQFLLASSGSYALGTTGGEATHTLTAAEMPSHNHTYDKANANTGSTTLTTDQIPSHRHTYTMDATNMTVNVVAGTGANVVAALSEYNYYTGYTGGGKSHSHTISSTSTNTGSKGSGNAHNNMPPYLVVNVWKRTA